jgi:molybdopterin-biosynthesis enzyme MoeA-like protein
MARVPEGAELIRNPVSGAPGIRIGNLFLMAGVPHITAGMLEGLSGRLQGGRPIVSVTIGGFIPESEVAGLLREAEAAHDNVSIGSYPFFREGRVGSNFVVRSDQGDIARAVADELADSIRAAGFEVTDGGI